jgi:hypothetical protein
VSFGCNFFILTILTNFFINRLLGKCFSYLNLGKSVSLGGALGALQGATMIGTLHGHIDQGRHGGL